MTDKFISKEYLENLEIEIETFKDIIIKKDKKIEILELSLTTLKEILLKETIKFLKENFIECEKEDWKDDSYKTGRISILEDLSSIYGLDFYNLPE